MERRRAYPHFLKIDLYMIKVGVCKTKFRLTKDEIDRIIQEEVLPYFDVVAGKQQVFFVCKDPHDDKFLSCAMAAHADLIVTGDQAFYELKKFKSVKIVSPAAFLKMLF